MKKIIAISIIVGIASIAVPAQAMVEHVLVRLDPPGRDPLPLFVFIPLVVAGAPPFNLFIIPLGSGVDP